MARQLQSHCHFIYEALGKDNSEVAIQPYAGRYNFWLFCNFTFFLNDPVNGDMIEPTDSRQLLGLNAKYKFYPNLGLGVATATLGGAYRADDMDVAPWHSHNCVRLEKRVDANIAERSLSLHFTPGNPRNLRLGGELFVLDLMRRGDEIKMAAVQLGERQPLLFLTYFA